MREVTVTLLAKRLTIHYIKTHRKDYLLLGMSSDDDSLYNSDDLSDMLNDLDMHNSVGSFMRRW